MKSVLSRMGPFIVAAAALAACSGGGSLPAATSSAPSAFSNAVAAPQILHYHLMPLRTRASSAAGADVKHVYPADLTRGRGKVMKTAVAYNIYVNCPTGGESCWGDPEGFQNNLTGSRFAGLLGQYTNSPPAAYTLVRRFSIAYTSFTNVLYDNDLMAILHQVLLKNGKKTGYSSLYHIFLPKGTDTCFDLTRACYSPDHPATFYFCAYHESVAFADIPGVALVSIEPYKFVPGCASRKSTGASALTNSTASTLGHETFEAITDPGPALAWYNFTFNSEIGDLCETYEWKIDLNGTTYSLQPMYSNAYHACAASP